jgi:hypothetical protein
VSRRIVLAVIAIALLRVEASAQLAYLWTFDELAAKADVVVIARPLLTRDTGKSTDLSELSPSLPVVELNTEFTILAALKGGPLGKTLVLRHYRLNRLKGPCVGCGIQMDFTQGGAAARQCSPGDQSGQPQRCTYLMFLAREVDGSFGAVSGRLFPNEAIRKIER